MQYAFPRSEPITLRPDRAMQVYLLFALAMLLTAAGVFAGALFAPLLFRGGTHLLLLAAELGIIFTANLWAERHPWNKLLFALFPLLSGLTAAPYVWYVSATYVNGNALLLNAVLATVFMAAAAAVFARTTARNLSGLSGFLLFGLLGLIGLGLVQLFVPALRQSTGFELALSGGGVLLFAVFTAFDVQRLEQQSRAGAPPFLLALSLYLDIFNLFLYVLRFMTALSGERR